MAVFQIESGACTGRGFSAIDVNGYLAKFYTWITKTPASGGPGWSLLLDKSATPTGKTISSVDTGTDIVTSTSHGFYNGDAVVYTTTGTAIGGLANGTTYYVRKINADTLYLTTQANLCYALNPSVGSFINLTSSGTGTHTLTLAGPYIVVAKSNPTNVNEVANILKIGYWSSEAGYVRVYEFLSWDDTNKVCNGQWGGYRIVTVDAGDFAYDFRGGDECMALFSRVSTSWTYYIYDTWTSINGLCEDVSVIGTLQTSAAAGSNVIVQLDTGEGSLFTNNNYYYIYDFNNTFNVNYVKVTSADTINDTLTIQTLSNNMTSGTKIGAYPHRYYSMGTNGYDAVLNNYQITYSILGGNLIINIPYYSGNIGYVFNDHTTNIYGAGNVSYLNTLNIPAPDDLNYYACMKPILSEYYRANSTSTTTGMNRIYGKGNNIFLTYGSMAQMLDYRTINSTDYLAFKLINGSLPNFLMLHTTSLS